MNDPLAFLDGEEEKAVPVEAVETVEAANPEPAQVEPEPVAEAPAVEAVVETPVSPQSTEGQAVPLAALLAERDKRMAEQERARQLEEQIAALSRQTAPIEQPPYDDPVAYTDFVAQQMAAQVHQHRYQLSEVRAAMQHGEKLVQDAKAWALTRVQADPLYDARVDQSADPFTVIVEDYKREQLLSQLTPDVLEQFQAWRAAQSGQASSPQAGAAPVPQSTKPAFTSLKSVAQAGGVKPAVQAPVPLDEEVFASVFP